MIVVPKARKARVLLPPHSVSTLFPHLVPQIAVEPVVHVTVLMVVVVEHAVRLPRLPPPCLESYARVLHDAVVVTVQGQTIKRDCGRKQTHCYCRENVVEIVLRGAGFSVL